MARRLVHVLPAILLMLIVALPAHGAVAYETHVRCLEFLTGDLVKVLPRAMGVYLYRNRYDFLRGMTFMTRDILPNPRKMLDIEEVRKQAYTRLMRDIPYCVEAFKGGEIKLDTSDANRAGRLGMIAYSIYLLKMPEFPDLRYLEKFKLTFDDLISDSVIDVWVFYDGYRDFNCLGELMESLKDQRVPSFRFVKNKEYNAIMKEDIYAMFRAPDKFNRHIILTNRDVNNIYSDMVNSIADALVYIWKQSGMDLAHPSYAAPPGTVIDRPSRRRILAGGAVQKPGRFVEETGEEEAEEAQGREGAEGPTVREEAAAAEAGGE